MAVAEVFRALGDPLRLEMVQRLSDGVPCTISVVSSELGISRQGARKHLQVLADAKVIVLEPRGRDVLVQLDREMLDQAKAFIAEIEMHWDRRLDALKRFVEEGD
jgi:DNA-binding transcriptional ArsR family regulator